MIGDLEKKVSDILSENSSLLKGGVGRGRILKKILFVLFGFAFLALAFWTLLALYGIAPSYDFPAVNSADWQAVFLVNNQVYFGHLKNYNKEYALLHDVFYLRVAEPLQQGSPPTTQPGINLVKLGGELHGPQDAMYLPKDKIMFWENLKSDSQIVLAIKNFLATQ